MISRHRLARLVPVILALLPVAANAALPAPGSPAYCVAVQEMLAGTKVEAGNTVFTDMTAFRKSKPSVQPLRIYQVVTYAGREPIMVSCKVKTAAHLRAVHGPTAAGQQRYCPDVTRRTQAEAVAALRQSGQAAAAGRAAAFVIDADEPYWTGRSFLEEFQLSYRSDDGAIHIRSPGLYQDYDSWITSLLPERLQGQSYCHLATTGYIEALATGAMAPGTTVSGAEDAPVTPR